jgi:tRNA-Thr(GGU) m(6)t(6)A37 methyltransferase TsaA
MSNAGAWQQPITIVPIGVVISDFKEFSQKSGGQMESILSLRKDLTGALLGIEHFSHIHVLYHEHRRAEWQAWVNWGKPGEQVLTMPLAGEPSCKGIYTTRSTARLAGIGSCVVELLRREANLLYVRGIDALDGSPILDLKIYIPQYDSIPWADAPLHWCECIPITKTSRMLHWDTMNVSLVLVLRAGQRALKELKLGRDDSKRANVCGGNFFAQGVEGVTGCSVLHGSMRFIEKPESVGDWSVCLEAGEEAVLVRLNDRLYAGADEVLSVSDDTLFATVKHVPSSSSQEAQET